MILSGFVIASDPFHMQVVMWPISNIGVLLIHALKSGMMTGIPLQTKVCMVLGLRINLFLQLLFHSWYLNINFYLWFLSVRWRHCEREDL